jgi:transposase-like protein
MLAAEERLGGPLETVVPQIYNETGTMDETSKKLGVDPSTLYNWMRRLGFEIRTQLVFTKQ